MCIVTLHCMTIFALTLPSIPVCNVYDEGPVWHQTDTACSAPNGYSLLVVGVPQSGGLSGGTLCKLYPPTPPLRRPGRPVFWGSQPCVPAAWLAERLLLAGDIESNPGLDLWLSPERVAPLLIRWKRRLPGLL